MDAYRKSQMSDNKRWGIEWRGRGNEQRNREKQNQINRVTERDMIER